MDGRAADAAALEHPAALAAWLKSVEALDETPGAA